MSYLNIILILGYCVGQRLTMELEPRHWPCKFIKDSSFGCKMILWCVLMEKCQFWGNRTARIYSPFTGRLGLLKVRDCKGEDCVWRRPWAQILWGNILRTVTGKTKSVWWLQIKQNNRRYLNSVVYGFYCINCLNACATFWNQKLWCVTLFLNKNDETKNSLGLSFKAQHQKMHIFCFGQTKLI